MNIAQVGGPSYRREHDVEGPFARQMLCDMQLHGSSSSAVHSADRTKSHTNGAQKAKAKTVKIEPQEGTLLVREQDILCPPET